MKAGDRGRPGCDRCKNGAGSWRDYGDRPGPGDRVAI